MCGIVGIVGQANIQEGLLNGLNRLEYRGYDSAGIYLVDHKHTDRLFKEVGRIAHLKETVDFNFSAVVGIGHTRWATHGMATRENAHPHQSSSQRYSIVHNGVIENYQELKNNFLNDVQLKSETDTEIVVALIELFANSEDLSTKSAFKRTLEVIKGSYALGLIDKENPEVLYAAKNKSPLLVGLGDNFNVIASDAMATIDVTNEYLEIKDKEIITLTKESVIIESFLGDIIQRESYIAELDASDLEKGAYPFYMLKEIDEQPAVLRRLIQAYQDQQGAAVFETGLMQTISTIDRIYIIACGTSYNAGWIGRSLLEKIAHIPTEVHLASEFAYDLPLLSERPLFIFLTQSGETADSRQALVRVNELKLPSLTITNVKGSTLSREASYTLLLHAGPEIAVASTKAYTAQISVLAMLADAIRESKGLEASFNMERELSLVASVMETILTQKLEIQSWVNENLLETRQAFYIGRTLDYYVSMEAALKLKEISYIQTEAFAAGELKHGTIALIEEGTPVIALITEEVVGAHTRGNVEEVKARGANTMIISMADVARSQDQFVIPTVTTVLSPLVTVVVTQLVAYYTALGRGLDVDKPRNLAKSVTVE